MAYATFAIWWESIQLQRLPHIWFSKSYSPVEIRLSLFSLFYLTLSYFITCQGLYTYLHLHSHFANVFSPFHLTLYIGSFLTVISSPYSTICYLPILAPSNLSIALYRTHILSTIISALSSPSPLSFSTCFSPYITSSLFYLIYIASIYSLVPLFPVLRLLSTFCPAPLSSLNYYFIFCISYSFSQSSPSCILPLTSVFHSNA